MESPSIRWSGIGRVSETPDEDTCRELPTPEEALDRLAQRKGFASFEQLVDRLGCQECDE